MASRRPPRPISPAVLLALLAVLGLEMASASPALAQGRVVTDAPLKIQDRILAVVDEDPVLLSDVRRVIGLGLAVREEGEADEALRRRVLDELIEQRLRLHEVDRFGFEQVPVDEIERQVEMLRSRFPDEAAFRRRLRDVQMTLPELRQLVARQLMVWIYFEEFLGPRIFVDLEEIRAYYENRLVPEMAALGSEAPPLAEVREQIRTVLQNQRLNDEIARRTEELRREADIVNYFDDLNESLPPVILELEPPPVGPPSLASQGPLGVEVGPVLAPVPVPVPGAGPAGAATSPP